MRAHILELVVGYNLLHRLYRTYLLTARCTYLEIVIFE